MLGQILCWLKSILEDQKVCRMLKKARFILKSKNGCPICGSKQWYTYYYQVDEFVPEKKTQSLKDSIKDGVDLAIVDCGFWGDYVMDICVDCGLALTVAGE